MEAVQSRGEGDEQRCAEPLLRVSGNPRSPREPTTDTIEIIDDEQTDIIESLRWIWGAGSDFYRVGRNTRGFVGLSCGVGRAVTLT
jgi:hypothetical protein